MKSLSFLSARLDVPAFCLVAALAAACSFDASQLRALSDVDFKFDSLRSSCGAGDPARPGCSQTEVVRIPALLEQA